MNKLFTSLFTIQMLFSVNIFCQNYTSYFTGSSNNISTSPLGGICLMGGSTEDDNAMRWFLEQANGGDILVLRTSGSDGYNEYLYSQLGISVNSVETIVFNGSSAVNENYIHEKILGAEAIWFAGGNQWNYVNYIRDTEVNVLINEAISERNIVIGGTSAGMAIMGGYYFTAQNGTVTSDVATSNPFDNRVQVDGDPFLQNEILTNVITDQHYDDPNRKGRHIVFMSRILLEYGAPVAGIACDEYTAVCIDNTGNARVFGEYPDYDDNAYFLQVNCEVAENYPETCSPGQELEWNQNNSAIKVYQVKGTYEGENSFDLNSWDSGIGGVWHDWYVSNGELFENQSTEIQCQSMSTVQVTNADFAIYPNPTTDLIYLNSEILLEAVISDLSGKEVLRRKVSKNLNISSLEKGTYILTLSDGLSSYNHKIIKK